MKWKFCAVLLLFCFLFSPLYSESSEELIIPDLIPTEEYVLTGQDLITLYTTINNLSETKNEYKSLRDEALTISENALELAKEYEKENQQLVLQNNFLIGTTVVSVGVVVAGVVTLIVMNVN